MLSTISLLLAAGAAAPPQVPLSVLYAPGRSLKDQAITLRAWGSGTIAETDEVALEGSTSVRVATRNYFQGGIMTFENPRDLSEDFEGKGNLLRLSFLLGDANLLLGKEEAKAPGGKMGGMRGGVASEGGAQGGGKGGSASRAAPTSVKGMPGGGETKHVNSDPRDLLKKQTAPTALRLSIKQIRLIVETTDGKKSEAYVPVGTSSASAGVQGWRSVSLPLQAIRGFDRTNKIIKEIAISADMVSAIYLGELRIVNDTTPITGEVNVRNLNLARGDEVTLWANAYGGSSVLVYQWDFDAADGIQVDAEGQTVKRKFRKPGSYTVTVTVRDLYDLKEPFVTSFPVKVNP